MTLEWRTSRDKEQGWGEQEGQRHSYVDKGLAAQLLEVAAIAGTDRCICRGIPSSSPWKPRGERRQVKIHAQRDYKWQTKGHTTDSTVRRQRCPGWEQTRKDNGQSCVSGAGASKNRGEPQKCRNEQERLAHFLWKLGEQEVAWRSRRWVWTAECQLWTHRPWEAMTERAPTTGKQCRSTPVPQRAVLMKSVTAAAIISSIVSLYE